MRHVAPPSEGDASVDIERNSEEEVEPADDGFEMLGQ